MTDWKDRLDQIKEKKQERMQRKEHWMERERLEQQLNKKDRFRPEDKKLIKDKKEEDIEKKDKNDTKKDLSFKERYKQKISKKVQDYFKFIHDQLKEMYEDVGSPHELEDRERENFYKQVREAWKLRNSGVAVLAPATLNKYTVTDHLALRMDERNVAPTKILELIKDGRQVTVTKENPLFDSDIGKAIVITKGQLLLIGFNDTKVFTTVIRDSKFPNEGDEYFIKKVQAHLRNNRRRFKYSEKERKMDVNVLKRVSTLEKFRDLAKNKIQREKDREQARKEEKNKKNQDKFKSIVKRMPSKDIKDTRND